MTRRTLEEIVRTLEHRLNGNPPGVKAQLRMTPSHRTELMRKIGAPDTRREAAVLAVITDAVRPSLVLTERRPDLKHHAGQISFPGGRREPQEELVQTALRESEEEIGLCSEDVTIVGRLSPLYVPPSRFYVHPFVGVVEGTPAFAPASEEVSRIILADIELLCDPATCRSELRTFGERAVEIPYFDVDGEKIWGATAMMIAELVEALSD